jgi:putative transposase
MRCKKEEFVKDAIFHIYNHSVDEINLFNERDDYLYFFQKLKDNYSSEELAIYGYCLMPNHFHFCIKQKSDRPIYDVFNRFIISYTLHFNAKLKRKGKVFANKLQHKKIKYFGDSDNYKKYVEKFDENEIEEYLYSKT